MAQYNQLAENVAEFYKNAFPIIRYFIENGADPNSQNGEALGNLCHWSNEYVLEIITYLLDHGAEVNKNSSLAYWTAFNYCRPKVLQLIISRGGKANVAKG
jgi:ankyrin repeat protein